MLAKASELAPDDAEIRYQYALCCYERVRTEEALSALEHWDNLSGLNPEIIANIGLLLMKLGAPERAEPAIRRAVADAGPDPQPLLDPHPALGTHQSPGRGERSHAAADRRAPLHTRLGMKLNLMRAQLAQRASEHEVACTLFTELLNGCKEPQLTHLLQFPLAKSLDALHRYDEAFDTLVAAHRSQIELLRLTAPSAHRARRANHDDHALRLRPRRCRRLGPLRRPATGGKSRVHRGLSRAPERRCWN